ncbi:MAG: hypothetical protein M3Q68_03715 [Actinomycetota bacterium]|nr:hypothetical protein [Actinomycetota bacterium]
MGDLEPHRRGGALAKVDNALLVVVAVVGVLVVLKVIGFIAGTVFFVVKLVIGAAVVYALLRLMVRSRGR